MSDELTAELRRVYEQAESAAWVALPLMGRPEDLSEAEIVKTAALLTVARHSAERQRGMEATSDMLYAASQSMECCGAMEQDETNTRLFRYMQSAAPLWVDKK